MTVRVVVADDQQLIRAGFVRLLEPEPDVEVVGEAADGRAAVELCRTARPDVVLMDIRMPVLDGIAATREVTASTGARVVVLTTYDRDEYVFSALEAGASGFLLKDAPPEELVRAIHVVAAGESLLAPAVTTRLVGELVAARARHRDAERQLARLTPREREVLPLLARGLSNAEIAARLHLGETTVKTHVAAVLDKLGVRDRVQAVVFAYEAGIVTPGR
ncbi:response regulator [Nocardioides caldifontis]|uniref:response regulator n=1 Tax=Nocardioides caldifontis TaxID=2588938 RepID=UPI0011DFEC77|nr:response regulator transcription factor [Nocardioides caldifontis]